MQKAKKITPSPVFPATGEGDDASRKKVFPPPYSDTGEEQEALTWVHVEEDGRGHNGM